MLVIWTSAGGYMLMYLAALQNVPVEVIEASRVDGANAWQGLRQITMPLLRPTTFLVLTLGLIGTWQVFDQIFVGTQGGPAGTTVTPAYLSYTTSFGSGRWGQGSAIAFLLFGLIVGLTLLQRFALRDRSEARARRAERRRLAVGRGDR